MINMESFLIWLGGVVFGLVFGFFFKLVLREFKESTRVSTISSSEVEAKKREVEKNSRSGPPFF